MNPLPPEVNTPELKPEKVGSLIKRFGIGAITGVAIAGDELSGNHGIVSWDVIRMNQRH